MSGPRRSRVLVVEDRVSVLKVLATILAQGHEVTTAGDRDAALALLGSGGFDVVVTDVRMPGMGLGGFDVLRAARSGSPAASVVMMTAYANVPDAVEAIKLGACDYLAKPVTADELRLAVARALEQRRGQAGDPGALSLGEAPAAPPAPGAAERSVASWEAVAAARDAASRSYLVRLLRASQGDLSRAAARAGMSRESLLRLLDQYEVFVEELLRPRGPEVR